MYRDKTDLRNKYDQEINNNNATVKIDRVIYFASDVLLAVDPDAYQRGFEVWLKSQKNETIQISDPSDYIVELDSLDLENKNKNLHIV